MTYARSLRLHFAALLVALALGACGGGGGGDDVAASPGSPAAPAAPAAPVAPAAPAAPGAPAVPPSAAASATLQVLVQSLDGTIVQGARIAAMSGGNATTDASGAAELKVQAGTGLTVALSKEGFASQVKTLTVPAGGTAATLRVTMVAREAPQTLADAGAGGTVTGKHGARAEFPAGSLVDANGRAVAGAVQMQITPVNVLTETAAFPGQFAGTQGGGSPVPIVSYGVAEFHPTQNGQKLQVAAGKSVVIEIPIYAERHQDGSRVAVGQVIPLWSLNEATGIWAQEGTGTVVASAQSPSGFALRASVTHFSWWNCDDFAGNEVLIAIKCMMIDAAGNPVVPLAPGQTCSVRAEVPDPLKRPVQLASTVIDAAGASGLRIPAGTVVDLHGDSTAGTARFAGFTSVNLTSNAAIVIPLVQAAGVTLTTPPRGATLPSPAPASVTLDGSADRVELYLGGVKVAEDASAPFDFSFDTSAVAEGHTTLQARAVRGGRVAGASDLRAVVVDRTPPAINLLRLNASAGDGQVRLLAEVADLTAVGKVEFFRGSTKIGESSTLPFQHTYTLQASDGDAVSFTARATDAAGNAGVSNAISFGTLAPRVSLSRTPASAVVTTSGALVFEAAATSVNGIARVEFFKGSAPLAQDTTAPFQLTYVVTGADQPSFTIMARAVDNVGNAATATFAVPVGLPDTSDRTPPTVAMDPLASPITTTSVELSAAASDNVGVAKVAFFVNGRSLGEVATPSSGRFRMVADTSLLSGSTTFSARAFDAAGNTAQSSVTANVAITTTLLVSPGQLAHRTGSCPPSMGISADGIFFVAHMDQQPNGLFDVRVSRGVQGTWTSLGFANDAAATNALEGAGCAEIGVSASGQPFVAMIVRDGRTPGAGQARILVRRLSGNAWETIRDIPLANPFSRVVLRMDGASRPVIAYTDTTNVSAVTVERFDGSNWQPLAIRVGNLGGGVFNFKLAVRPDNSLVLAVQSSDGPFATKLHALNITDAGTTPLGDINTRIIDGTGDTTRGVILYGLAVTATETVVSSLVAADRRDTPTRVRRFDATTNRWVQVGTDAEQLLPAEEVLVAFQGSSLVQVATRPAAGRRFTGTAWTAFSSLSPVQSVATNIVVFQGALFLVYTHDTVCCGGSGVGVARIDVP
ncbi:MAG TPA: Ig-like domain-containing protein [Ramlibacter sp.]|jgi:hypothetical protein|nr:Ig-like domain-containing protein [Ramlibacter sp.]